MESKTGRTANITNVDEVITQNSSVEQYEAELLIEKLTALFANPDRHFIKRIATVCVDEMISEFLQFSEPNEETQKRFNELITIKKYLKV